MCKTHFLRLFADTPRVQFPRVSPDFRWITERRVKILVAFLLCAFMMLGDLMANTFNNSLIFHRVGEQAFFYMVFAKAVTLLVVTPIMAGFSGRHRAASVLFGFLIFLLIVSVAGIALFDKSAYGTLIVFTLIEAGLLNGFNFTIWPVVHEAFRVEEHQRVIPLISSGYWVAGVGAGAVCEGTLDHFGLVGMGWGVLGLILLGSLCSIYFIKNGRKKFGVQKKERIGFWVSLPEVFRKGGMLKWYLIFTVLFAFSFRVIDFEFNDALRALTSGEKDFAEKQAYYYSALCGAIVFYQLVLARKVQERFGLSKLMRFFPVGSALVTVVILLSSNSWIVLLGRAVLQFYYGAFFIGVMTLLYVSVKKELRASAQALVEGFGNSFGSIAAAGIMLFSFTTHGQFNGQFRWNFLSILLSQLGMWGSVLILEKRFLEKLKRNLEARPAEEFPSAADEEMRLEVRHALRSWEPHHDSSPRSET